MPFSNSYKGILKVLFLSQSLWDKHNEIGNTGRKVNRNYNTGRPTVSPFSNPSAPKAGVITLEFSDSYTQWHMCDQSVGLNMAWDAVHNMELQLRLPHTYRHVWSLDLLVIFPVARTKHRTKAT